MPRWALCAAFFLVSASTFGDQRIIVDSFVPADFLPESVTPITAAGFWAAGTANGLAALVHYDAVGAPTLIHFPLSSNAKSFTVVALPDGGAVTTNIEDSDVLGDVACKLRRFDSYGNLSWAGDGYLPFYGLSESCADVRVDGSGGIWLFSPGFPPIVVNPDGTAGAQHGPAGAYPAQALAAKDEGAVYLAGWTGDAYTPPGTFATLWKVTSQGVEWSSPAPFEDAGGVFEDLVVSDDSTLWAFGSKDTQLYGMHVAADGQKLWSGVFDTTVTPTNVKLAARQGGGVFTLHWDSQKFENQQPSAAPEISAFATNGNRVWHQAAGFILPSGATDPNVAFASAGDGDVIAALTYYDDAFHHHAYVEQVRADASANVQYLTGPQLLPHSARFELHVLADNSSLAVADGFFRFARNGEALPTPLSDGITTAASLDSNAALAADGSVFLVVTNASSKTFAVIAYSSAGLPLWHTAIASSWDNGGLQSAQIVLRAEDVCVAGYLDASEMVQCFARAGGTAAPQVALSGSIDRIQTRTQMTATDGNEVVVLYTAADGVHHALLDAQNNVLHNVKPLVAGETWGSASAQNASGQSVLATATSSILKLEKDGSRAYSVPTDLHASSVALSLDGSAMLMDISIPALERVDNGGQKLWQSPLSPGGVMRSPRFTDTYFYFTRVVNLFFHGYEGAPGDAPTSKYALNDGSLEWEQAVPYLLGYSPRLQLDPDNGALITFSTWGNRTLVRKLSTTDGTALGSKFVPCEVDECVVFQAIVATDGTLRMVHDTSDFYRGSAFEITIMQNEFDTVFANSFEP